MTPMYSITFKYKSVFIKAVGCHFYSYKGARTTQSVKGYLAGESFIAVTKLSSCDPVDEGWEKTGRVIVKE